MNRVVEWLVVILWLVSMTWLVAVDAVPRWFAQEPPRSASRSWLEQQGDRFQYGIYGENSLHKGSCWTVYEVSGETITRTDYLSLNNIQLIGDIMLKSEMVFLGENELDSVWLVIKGMKTPIELRGERQGPKFAFELKIGTFPPSKMVLDAEAARTLCDVIKPFSTLQNLQVGQSWKIHVLDPFAMMRSDNKHRLNDVVVKVTGRETIRLQGKERECYVVESEGVRAWVTKSGRVLLQEVRVPGLGTLEIREQSFSQEKLDEFRKRMGGVIRRYSNHYLSR